MNREIKESRKGFECLANRGIKKVESRNGVWLAKSCDGNIFEPPLNRGIFSKLSIYTCMQQRVSFTNVHRTETSAKRFLFRIYLVERRGFQTKTFCEESIFCDPTSTRVAFFSSSRTAVCLRDASHHLPVLSGLQEAVVDIS